MGRWDDGKGGWHIVKESAKSIGVAKLAPRDLRRTCARLCHASGGELEQIQFPLSPRRSATNPKVASAQPSRGSWAVRHGNRAVAGIWFPLPIAKGKPPAPISSNLSLIGAVGGSSEHLIPFNSAGIPRHAWYDLLPQTRSGQPSESGIHCRGRSPECAPPSREIASELKPRLKRDHSWTAIATQTDA
jgi:hypothetical protein